jgi:hypothetical protein
MDLGLTNLDFGVDFWAAPKLSLQTVVEAIDLGGAVVRHPDVEGPSPGS